ncbi:MAG: FG-GAP repeat domain-containing protein, partial [Gemmataceae bacterium]
MSVWLANLAMTSLSNTNYPLSASNPFFPTIVADLNGDGIDDIVTGTESDVSHNIPPMIDVLIGNSDGTFQPPVKYTVGPTGLVSIADVNHDNKPDLIVVGSNFSGNPSDPTLQVLLNNGDGSFASPIDGPSGLTNAFLAVAGFFSGGTNVDLATSDGHVLLGDGTGHFTVKPGIQFPFANGMVAGDFNNDGHTDLALTNVSTQSVGIYLNNGDGTFTAGNQYATTDGSFTINANDLDGDGNLDLIVGSESPGGTGPDLNDYPFAHYLLGRGDGTFAGAPLLVSGGTAPASFAVDTFEGGTKEDIITTGSNDSGDQLVLFSNDGNGNFTLGPSTLISLSRPLLTSGDLNDDGKTDAVMAAADELGGTTGTVATALGDGNGMFQSPVSASVAIAPAQIALGKFTSTVNPDLVVAGNVATNTAGLVLLPTMGDGTFKPLQTIDTLGANSQAAGLIVTDLDKDGNQDIVLSNAGDSFDNPPTPGALLVYMGKGGGAFQPAATVPLPSGMPFGGTVAALDLNDDGIPDLVFAASAGFANYQVYVALGKGNGTFNKPTMLGGPAIFGVTSIVMS